MLLDADSPTRSVHYGDFSRIQGSYLYRGSRNDRKEGSGEPLSLAFPSYPPFSTLPLSFSFSRSCVRASGRHYLQIAERRRHSDSGFIALPTRRSPRAEAGIRYVVFSKRLPLPAPTLRSLCDVGARATWNRFVPKRRRSYRPSRSIRLALSIGNRDSRYRESQPRSRLAKSASLLRADSESLTSVARFPEEVIGI